MCRAESEPGGPRRCSNHMRERLQAAQDALAQTTAVLTERDLTRRYHKAALEGVQERIDRGEDTSFVRNRLKSEESKAAVAESHYQAARRQRASAATAVALAQIDYDSTRDGLHDLRTMLDSEPVTDETLVARYRRARQTYDNEASHREVEFGPQVPMSDADLDQSPTGRALARSGTKGWLKSAATPDSRTGLYSHRVNLVRRGSGARRSATLPYLSSAPVRSEPEEGEWVLPGEPSLGRVAQEYDEQASEVRRFTDYVQWRQHKGLPNSLIARQRWRAAQTVSQRLTAFLEPAAKVTS